MSIQRVRTKEGFAYKVRVRMVDAATGKVRHPSRTFQYRKEAEKCEREWQGDIDRGTAVDPNKLTVDTYLRGWLERKLSRVKPNSAANYRQAVESYITPHLGAILLQKLTAQRIQQFEQDLLTSGRKRGPGGISKTYVHNIHVTLKGALKEAVKLGLLAVNVADGVTPPPVSNPPKVTWDQAQAQLFLRIAESDPYWPGWLLALATGMRRGELLGLRWQDVDLKTGVLTIRANVTAPDGVMTEGSPKSNKGRPIQIERRIVKLLDSHRKAQIERHLRIGTGWNQQTPVLTSAVGTLIHPFNFSKRFRNLIEGVEKLPKIRFHDVRHSAASLMLIKGVHPKVVSEMLGHADIRITLAIYGHVLPGMGEAAARVIASVLLDPTAVEQTGEGESE